MKEKIQNYRTYFARLLAIAVPLILLYELSYLVVRYVLRR